MPQVAILFRKSKHYPEKVICGVFDGADDGEVLKGIATWKLSFFSRFPEFREAEFSIEWVDYFTADTLYLYR